MDLDVQRNQGNRVREMPVEWILGALFGGTMQAVLLGRWGRSAAMHAGNAP